MAMQFSKQQQQYLGAGAIFLALGGFFYVRFFWMPISQKIADLSAQIDEIDSKIAKATAQASRLNKLQADLAKLNQDAIEAERRLPKEKSVPDVLVTLSTLAQQNRVDVMSFAPGPQKAQQYFTELSYPMTVHGSYHNIGRFLAAIALEERIFNVKDIVYPAAASDGAMTVSFTLLTYQYKG